MRQNKHSFRPPVRKDFIKRVDNEQRCDARNFTRLAVDIFGGNLILLPSAGQTLVCRMQWNHKEKVNDKIMPKVSYEGEAIKVSQASGLSSFFKYQQRNAYIVTLEIPSHLTVDVQIKVGQIYLDQVQTPALSLQMKVGSIDGIALTKKADVVLGVGSIKLHGLQGSAKIRITLGDIEATFGQIGKRDHVDLHATAGDVKSLFPAGTLAHYRPKSKNGEIINKVGAEIKIHAGLWGDMYVT